MANKAKIRFNNIIVWLIFICIIAGGIFAIYRLQTHLPTGIPLPSAYQNTDLNEFPFVSDDADLLSDDEEKEIQKYSLKYQQKTKGQVAVVTTRSIYDAADIDAYANFIFNKIHLGDKDKDNGVLIVYSTDDGGHCRIEVGYGLEDVLTDAQTGKYLRDGFEVINGKPTVNSPHVGIMYVYRHVISDLYNNADIKYDKQISENNAYVKNHYAWLIFTVMIWFILSLIYALRLHEKWYRMFLFPFLFLGGGSGDTHGNSHNGGGGSSGGGGASF